MKSKLQKRQAKQRLIDDIMLAITAVIVLAGAAGYMALVVYLATH